MSLPYSNDVYKNRQIDVPKIPETVYYPNLPIVEPKKEPNPEPEVCQPIPEPAVTPPIPEPTTVDTSSEENKQNAKSYFESKTREMILTNSRSNLELFKIIHNQMTTFEQRIDTLANALVELSSIVQKQSDSIQTLNITVGDLSSKLEILSSKVEKFEKNEKPKHEPPPVVPLKRTLSTIPPRNVIGKRN